MCFSAMNLEFFSSYGYMYEIIMSRIASILGNEGDYDFSNSISNKLLKESLRNRKVYALVGCIYNNLWNFQQNENCDREYIMLTLKKAYKLSDIAKLHGWKDFLQRKLKDL